MAESDLTRIGLLPNEQICLCDRPAANPSAHSTQRGNNSRYSPGLGAGGSSISPGVVTAPTNGKYMTRFAMNAGTSGSTYFNYGLHTTTTTLNLEMEMAALINNPGSGSGRVDAFVLRAASTDIVVLRWVQGTGWLLRYRTGASGYSQTTLSAGLDIAGNEHTVRFVYTGTDTAGVNNGTCEVWIGSAGDSSLDTDTIGGAFTGMTKVADVAHSGEEVHGMRLGWIASNDTALSNTANSGIYFRYLAPYMTEATPVAAGTGGVTWNRDAFLWVEKSDIEWDAAANGGEGGWDVRFGIIWPQHYFDGSVLRRARVRVWADYADLGTVTNEIANTGSWTDITADAVGYCRGTLTIQGLLPDSPYWSEVQLNGNDGSGAWFVKSTDATGALHGCFRTPAKPGVAPASPPRIYVSSCYNDVKWGPNEFWSNGETIGVGSGDGDKTHFRLWLGDMSYMDERTFDKSGTNQEGAETESQMKDTLFMIMHSYHFKRAAMKTLMRCVGDDHDRSCNDASIKHLLEEDGSSWDRDRDTVAEAAWADNIWAKQAISTTNVDYNFPCAINDGGTEYTITPRALAGKLLEVNRQVFSNTLPSSAGSFRFDPSGVDKYGANQGASGDTLDADDSQFTYLDMGNIRYLFLDTRLFTDRSVAASGTLLGAAKTWVKAAISGCDLPGLVFVLPGYVQGVGAGATLKQNDNYATSDVTDFTDERAEIFLTDIDANSAIKWSAVLCGDHHFLSIDQTINDISSKHRVQIGAGGSQSQPHDPADIDDAGYLLLSDGSDSGSSLTASDVVRTMCYFEVTNEQTGAMSVSAFRVANDGLDALGSFEINGVATATPRSRDRSRAR